MGLCSLREIKQLDRLRRVLNLPPVCPEPKKGETHYVVGYCQGLFNQEGSSPAVHTEQVARYLQQIGAPMPNSHELFMGLKPAKVSVQEYVDNAIPPLGKEGRVPIIITTYGPARERKAIDELLATKPPVEENHTLLARVQLDSADSIVPAAQIIRQAYAASQKDRQIPTYWPLLQADNFSAQEWKALQSAVGKEVWPYVTIAATPCTVNKLPDTLADNVAVYQFFVGRAEDVHADGNINLRGKACVGNKEGRQGSYNVLEYAHALRGRGLDAQVAILCGQSQGWAQNENIERVARSVPLIKDAARILWKREL